MGVPREGSLAPEPAPTPHRRGLSGSDCWRGHEIRRLAGSREGWESPARDPRRGGTEEAGLGLGLSRGVVAPIPHPQLEPRPPAGPHAQQVLVGPRAPASPSPLSLLPHPPRFPPCKPCLGLAAALSAWAAAGGSSLVSPPAPHWPPEGSANLQSWPCPTSPLAQDKACKAWAPLSSPESPDPWERHGTEPHWPLFSCGAWGGWANISVLGVLVRRSRLVPRACWDARARQAHVSLSAGPPVALLRPAPRALCVQRLPRPPPPPQGPSPGAPTQSVHMLTSQRTRVVRGPGLRSQDWDSSG